MALEINVPDQVVVHANPLISEVFKNYINNAIKYSGSGKKIVITAEIDGDAVSVSVNDFGTAIPRMTASVSLNVIHVSIMLTKRVEDWD